MEEPGGRGRPPPPVCGSAQCFFAAFLVGVPVARERDPPGTCWRARSWCRGSIASVEFGRTLFASGAFVVAFAVFAVGGEAVFFEVLVVHAGFVVKAAGEAGDIDGLEDAADLLTGFGMAFERRVAHLAEDIEGHADGAVVVYDFVGVQRHGGTPVPNA